MPRTPNLGDWLSLLVLTVIWGSAFLFIKLALASLTPAVIVTGRILIGAAVVYGYLRIAGGTLPGKLKDWAPMTVIALFGTALPFNLIAWAQQYIDSSMAGVLMAAMPLFVLSLAHFFVPGAGLTRYRAVGFLLGFTGIVIAIGPDLTQSRGNMGLLGSLAVLGAAFSYSVSTVYTRRLGNGNPMRRAAGMLIIASVLSAPAALVELPSATMPTISSALALGFLGLLATGFATILFFKLIQGPGPTFLSMVNFLVPVWAVFVGALFLNEELTAWVFVGLVFILTGIAMSEFGAQAARRASRLFTRSIATATRNGGEEA